MIESILDILFQPTHVCRTARTVENGDDRGIQLRAALGKHLERGRPSICAFDWVAM